MPSQDTGPRLTVVSPLQVTVPPAHCQPLQHSLHSPKACYLRQGPIHRAGQGNEGGKRTEKIPKRPTSARRVSSNLFSVHSECLVSCPDVHPPPPPRKNTWWSKQTFLSQTPFPLWNSKGSNQIAAFSPSVKLPRR